MSYTEFCDKWKRRPPLPPRLCGLGPKVLKAPEPWGGLPTNAVAPAAVHL